MRSNIKLFGPPIYDAIKALEKMSIDMPEVCIMDTIIATTIPSTGHVPDSSMGGTPLIPEGVPIYSYFRELGDITKERCDTIVSKSSETLGDYDFYFEWFQKPNMEQIKNLIKAVDETLAPLGVRYSITTK